MPAHRSPGVMVPNSDRDLGAGGGKTRGGIGAGRKGCREGVAQRKAGTRDASPVRAVAVTDHRAQAAWRQIRGLLGENLQRPREAGLSEFESRWKGGREGTDSSGRTVRSSGWEAQTWRKR